MAWYDDVWDFAKENALELAKMGGAGAKAYIDIKDQKRRNELEEAAYRKYLSNVEAAGKEAQAAIDLNLMPMEISNVPTSKADVSDFTAMAARGGLMNLPTRQRKRYYAGTDEEEVMETEEEILTPDYLMKEEGVPIGPMAAFPDTGNPMSNAQQVWESGAIDQGIYQMDFNIFFQSGDWMDYIGKGEVQENMQIASDPSWEAEWDDIYENYKAKQISAGQEFVDKETFIMQYQDNMANGGIIGLRHGGRPGYAESNAEEFEITKSVEAPEGYYDISTRDELNPNEMLSKDEEFWNRKFSPEFVEQGQKYEGQQEKLYALAASIMQSSEGLSFQQALQAAEEIYFKKGFITKKEYEHPLDTDLAKGGRVKRDNGGIMNLGGLEKDYRTTGGFVPIGAYEKKDDVPARLSKNEFVMTADAVRAAGGGSINRGAQRMYDTMKHLEARPEAKRMTA